MWPSLDIRIFQDASWFEIIYWILSPISVIAASGVAVFLTKSRDWKEDKNKIGYFSDIILFLYVRFDTFVKSIKLYPDSLSSDEALQGLFISCKKTAQDFNINLVEVAKYCPSIGVAKDLLHLDFQFDALEKCLAN